MKSFSIIGCGAVGKTLGRLFHDKGIFRLVNVLARSRQSAQGAAEFIGAGHPVASFRELEPADLYLIAVSDGAIAACAGELAATGLVGEGTLACHLSGALESGILQPLRELGASAASVHPVKSFADPARCVCDFAGTWCGIEGDAQAVESIGAAFEGIGARLFSLDPAFKTAYHAGSVLVCNYLTALLEAGLRAYGKGGVPREVAMQVMEPLVRGTVDNVFRSGTVQALTGPIARGDAAVVARQLDSLREWDPDLARIYQSLGVVALDLSRSRGQAGESALAEVALLLSTEK